MQNLLAVVALAAILAPGVAQAGRNADAEALAARASAAVDEHCSDAAQADVTGAAESVAKVSTVWAEVSKALEANRKVYLLYWRGVLGQCLDQEDKALADFEEFVAARGGSSMWAPQVEDAARRIRLLKRKLGVRPEAPPEVPGIVIGAALGGGAGVAGALAGWQWSDALAVAQGLAEGEHVGGDGAAYKAAGDDAATTSHVLVGAAVGMGAAAVVSVVAGVTRRRSGSRHATVMVPLLLPAGTGVLAGFGGAW